MRRVLAAVLVAATFLAACSLGGGSSASSTPRSTDQATTTETAPAVPVLPAPAPYVPLPGEPEPEAKRLAAGVLQAIGTYPFGAGDVPGATERAGEGIDPTLIAAAANLLVPDAAASVEIVYPQLGGLTADKASVMVVFRQTLRRTADDDDSVVRTADVRLGRVGETWTVTSIESMGGEPPLAPTLSPVGEAVLDNQRIELPDSARWDIEAGRIDDRVLQLLGALSTSRSLSVTVLASGHPYNVFESASVSNHSVGRGVDIWAVDGVPVIEQRDPSGALHQLVEDLLARGAVTELGSPWDLDGVGAGVSFTNTVHQDHLHLAFDD